MAGNASSHAAACHRQATSSSMDSTAAQRQTVTFSITPSRKHRKHLGHLSLEFHGWQCQPSSVAGIGMKWKACHTRRAGTCTGGGHEPSKAISQQQGQRVHTTPSAHDVWAPGNSFSPFCTHVCPPMCYCCSMAPGGSSSTSTSQVHPLLGRCPWWGQ